MHVCYVSHTGEAREGGERSLLELLRYVRHEAGHRVSVLCPPGPLVEEIERLGGITRYEMPFLCMRRSRNPLELGRFALSYLDSARRMRALLDELRPDLLHANSATAALYAVAGARGTGIPIVWHMRDIQPSYGTFRLVLPRVAARVERVVAISEAVAENLRSFGIDPARITVIHNAVAPPVLRGGTELRQSLGLDAEDLLLGVVGKLISRKGQLTAIRALRRIRNTVPGARLALWGGEGDADYRTALEAEMSRLDLRGAVIFGGYRAPGEIFDALDVLLVPSQEEPFGRVVVEAMFAEVPVIASRTGGIPEIARDRREALLVPVGDDAAVAEAALSLAADREFRDGLVASAADRARSEFSWSATGTKAGRLYQEIAAGGVVPA